MDTSVFSSVYFPQSCSHCSHAFNESCELRTALVTGIGGADQRLALLRDGSLLISSDPLSLLIATGPVAATTTESPLSSAATEVEAVCINPFVNNRIEVVVATPCCLLLFTYNDDVGLWADVGTTTSTSTTTAGAAEGQEACSVRPGLRYRRLRVSFDIEKPLPMFRRVPPSVRGGGGGGPRAQGSSAVCSPLAHISAVEFAGIGLLCVVSEREAVLIAIQADGSDVVTWSSRGMYRHLNICPAFGHIALSLARGDTLAVFPYMGSAAQSLIERGGGATPSVSSFNPHMTTMQASNYAEVGLVAGLGVYRVRALRWRRASHNTLLCVSCTHPQEAGETILLYSVQWVPIVKSFDNVVDPGAALTPMSSSGGSSGVSNATMSVGEPHLQLVPCGNISLFMLGREMSAEGTDKSNGNADEPPQLKPLPHSTYNRWTESGKRPPISEMVNGLIPPTFSLPHTAKGSWHSNKLEFLHIEGDGTVRTSSYRFGKQKHTSFAKQRACGQVCVELLKPLFEQFGHIERIDTLPLWKSHPVEVGTVTPYGAEQLTSRRYRFVAHFRESRVVAAVVVDLSAHRAAVECFLSLGNYRVGSLFAVPDSLPDGTRLVAGLAQLTTREAVGCCAESEKEAVLVEPSVALLFCHRGCGSSLVARLLSVSSVSSPLPKTPAAAKPAPVVVTPEVFIGLKCPEKTKMIPALLKACGGDEGKLLTQLTAKYGALDPAQMESLSTTAAAVGTTEAEAPASVLVDARLVPGGVGVGLHDGSWLIIPSQISAALASVPCGATAGGIQLPCTLPAQPLTAPPCRGSAIATEGEVTAVLSPEQLEGQFVVSVTSPVSTPASICIPAVLSPRTDEQLARHLSRSLQEAELRVVRIEKIATSLLVNDDVAIGVLCCTSSGTNGGENRVLLLYGLPAVQSLSDTGAGDFTLEGVLLATSYFYMGARGELVVAREGSELCRWLRCFPTKEQPYCHYVLDTVWREKSSMAFASLAAVPSARQVWGGEGGGGGAGSATRTHFVYTTEETDYLRYRCTPFRLGGALPRAGGSGERTVPQHHPDTLMQLIAMAQWELTFAILSRVAAAVREVMQGTSETGAATASHRLCVGAIAKGLHDSPTLLPDAELRVVRPRPLVLSSEEMSRLHTQKMSEAFLDTAVLKELIEHLPLVTLEGLSSTEQLSVVCVLEALSAAAAFSRSVDEAAARYYFFYRLASLRRRLRLRDTSVDSAGGGSALSSVDPSSILFFEEAPTASRGLTAASFLWALMSDSQATILATVLPTAPPAPPMAIHDIGHSGVAYWLRSPAQLRTLAECVAKGQFQQSKDVTECALMYCVARKTSTLAALCKMQNNEKLQAFFSRDFDEERNRSAASANAFAAVGKGKHLYGAAFFVLARDYRSAAQTILQRCGDASLALFVLRACAEEAGSPEAAADARWFIEIRETTGRPQNIWERTSVRWISGDAVGALRQLAEHPTAHPEVLATLLYAAHSVTALAMRGHLFLSPAKEVICIARLGRFSAARHLALIAGLRFYATRKQLDSVVAAVQEKEKEEEGKRRGLGGAGAAGKASAPSAMGHMQADFSAGTLAFKMSSDSDDDDKHNNNNRANPTLPPTSATTATATANANAKRGGDGGEDDEEVIADVAVRSLERELSFCMTFSPNEEASGHSALRVPLDSELVHALTVGLFLRTARQAPMKQIEAALRRLMDAVHPFAAACAYDDVHPRDQEEVHRRLHRHQGERPTEDDLLLSTLRLTLAAIATRTGHYGLALALCQLPSSPAVLRAGAAADQHPVVVFFAALHHALNRDHVRFECHEVEKEARRAAAAAAEETELPILSAGRRGNVFEALGAELAAGEAAAKEQPIFSPTSANEPGGLFPASCLTPTSLVASLFSWFYLAELQLCYCSLVHTPEGETAAVTEGRQEPEPRFPLRAAQWASVLCLYSTLTFHREAMRLHQQLHLACGVELTHVFPNGLFTEQELEMRQLLETLAPQLATHGRDDSDDGQAGQLVWGVATERCGVLWQFPRRENMPLPAVASHFLSRLSEESGEHYPAQQLRLTLLGAGSGALHCVASLWLQRFHTHDTLRRAMLSLALSGGLAAAAAQTDRVLLSQNPHPVQGVGFDCSSCDSVVWASEAGVRVGHGFRELLAQGNGEALELQLPERNMATAAFSASLTSQKLAAAMTAAPTTTANNTAHRPTSGVSNYGTPSAHPHLPFFLMAQKDGLIDAFPFASHVSVASFATDASRPTVPQQGAAAGFSPNGYLFVLPLQDGSVAGWSFTAAPAGARPRFRTPAVCEAGTISAAFFCGERSSVVAVAGLSSRGASVPLLTLLDVSQPKPSVLVRCALPFSCAFAVHLGSRYDAVLCVSTAGRMAVYDVGAGALTVIATRPLRDLYQRLGAPAPDAAAGDGAVVVTSLAVSAYDALAALGLSNGAAVLLSVETLKSATAKAAEMQNDYRFFAPSSEDSAHRRQTSMATQRKQQKKEGKTESDEYVNWEYLSDLASFSALEAGTRMEAVTHSAIECLCFSPSLLLCGLHDGKVVGMSLVPQQLRQRAMNVL